MADNTLKNTVSAIFDGLDGFITSKTVIGESIKVDGATIIPLIDVTCGMGMGAFSGGTKDNGAGGMSAKMSPAAVLVIQNGVTKLINIRSQDPVTKVLDIVPDLINKFTSSSKISQNAVKTASDMAKSSDED